MTPDEIRAQAVAVVVEHLKPVTYRCCDECERLTIRKGATR